MAAAAALRLLDNYPDEIPNVVTDLILLLHEARRYSSINDAWEA